jgi:division/cell wall cluster transcriptional repressor MraZ
LSTRPFTGHRDHRIDSKDRLVVPAHFAEVIARTSGGVLYLVPAENRMCVQAYPAALYDQMSDRLACDPLAAEEASDAKERRFFERAEAVELKGPGRITLGKRMQARYFPHGVVRIAGRNKFLELWDPERWEQHVGDGDPVEKPTDPEPTAD